eukprot:7649324-Alexandrium_andersonii.AAC.1
MRGRPLSERIAAANLRRAAAPEPAPEPAVSSAVSGADASAPATLDSATSGEQSAINKVETFEEER